MLTTPLRIQDVLTGHLLWMATRIGTTCAVYLAVILFAGGGVTATAVLALPAALLVGMAFAVPITAFSARQQNDAGFAGLFRFGIIPLFLFSGTFFPVSQLPAFLQPIAYLTPLWHGVELCRDLMLGTGDFGSAMLHVLYLGLWVVGGAVLALLAFRSRLID
jgi:lipooligosaccharide transport system permease protein